MTRLRIYLTGIIVLVAALSMPASTLAAEPDWAEYDKLLKRYVAENDGDHTFARVDYSTLRHEPGLTDVIARLAGYPVKTLASREEKLAFYINAYNILAIKIVLDHWPLASLRDAGSFWSPVWEKPAGIVGGRSVTLDEIEHEILRPLGEPRVHFAIVCASRGCPDLRREPYSAAHLNAQLSDQARRFLRNPYKGLRLGGGRIRISRIFDWFASDFDRVGGVETFVRRHRPDLPPGQRLRADLGYDWSLNGDVHEIP